MSILSDKNVNRSKTHFCVVPWPKADLVVSSTLKQAEKVGREDAESTNAFFPL